jgi:hypothetical protein
MISPLAHPSLFFPASIEEGNAMNSAAAADEEGGALMGEPGTACRLTAFGKQLGDVSG